MKFRSSSPVRFAVCLVLAVTGIALPSQVSQSAPPQEEPPTLEFSTFVSDLGGEFASAVAVDPEGNVYVVGQTASTTWPVMGAAQPANAGGSDVVVAKISTDGSTLLYATYLGGSRDEVATGIAVDSDGCAYVTGRTLSLDFPTSPDAYDRDNGRFTVCMGADCIDGFVTKISPDGGSFAWSTYLGGEHDDYPTSIAVDQEGNTYITGSTNSFGWPRVNAFNPDKLQGNEACVTKLNATGTAVVYSSYLGGNKGDNGSAITVDRDGNAIIVGSTFSEDFLTRDPFQTENAGGGATNGDLDAFVTKVDADGALVFSSYLGGTGRDLARGVTTDEDGTIYVTGQTSSTDFPTAAPSQASLAGGFDAFVARIPADGSAIEAATYLGGGADEEAHGAVALPNGRVAIVGTTRSADFPVSAPLQDVCGGCVAPQLLADVFVAIVDTEGSEVPFATFLGGRSADEGFGIVATGDGGIVIAGRTFSTDFPTTPGVFQQQCMCVPGNTESAFVARIAAAAAEPVDPPVIESITSFKRPFRLEIRGRAFDPEAQVFIGDDTVPWPFVEVVGDTLITVGGKKQLKQRLPKRVPVPIRVVNPDGGEAVGAFTR